MCVGSLTAGTWSSSQWRRDDEFETDRVIHALELASASLYGNFVEILEVARQAGFELGGFFKRLHVATS